MSEDISKAKLTISLAKFLLICYYVTAGRISGEL
jgi:hypothetical protein